MIVHEPKFCDVPSYLHRLAEVRPGTKKIITYMGMIVSFGEHLWEIPLVVSEDSFFLQKLYARMDFGEMFASPDHWYSFNFEVANDPG